MLRRMEPIPEDWKRGVVIVAHPDDIEYGAAAAVARWTGQGKDIRYVLATSGEAGIAGLPPAECGPLREEEERRSAAVVGVDEVEFLGHPDGRLQEGLDLRRDLAGAIRRHRPEFVLTMNHRETWGPGFLNSADHRALGQSVLDAVSDAANEWIFPELTEPQWTGVQWVAVNVMVGATHAVDVSAAIDTAVASLAEHSRYLQALSDVPVLDQARAQIEMATGPRDGFAADRAVGFELFQF
ncbi:LmbE family N-acetylglucosaminyl deacetylase [Rhodococcus sp. PvR044]|jgi:LmbE family N-acetylglucosaminyl deacetylase|nr:LmbE family N-acetylglucosaminyl deacetylase [Rhodococcus sp. OK611]SNX90580.1 N-acetylglucosaminyl deacetylase, LmbE family [Rhodococcus sp. OK270]